MNCKYIENGICNPDFNCGYFKEEPIPSGVECAYKPKVELSDDIREHFEASMCYNYKLMKILAKM